MSASAVEARAERVDLDRVRRDIEQRIAELEPLVAELEQLRRALAALEGVTDGGRQDTTDAGRSKQKPGRRRGLSGRIAVTGQAARARRGERRRQLLALVESDPGI